jgi:hypothetical protein
LDEKAATQNGKVDAPPLSVANWVGLQHFLISWLNWITFE